MNWALNGPFEVQLSYHREVEAPVVITFLNPLSKRGFAALHAAHVQEHEPLDAHGFLLELLERYLAFKTWAQGEGSSGNNFQLSLAMRARFFVDTQPTIVFWLCNSVPVRKVHLPFLRGWTPQKIHVGTVNFFANSTWEQGPLHDIVRNCVWRRLDESPPTSKGEETCLPSCLFFLHLVNDEIKIPRTTVREF